MISILNLLEAALIIFAIFSYTICGYLAFAWDATTDPDIRTIRAQFLPIRIIIWLIAPLVVLELVVEYIFGWSPLSK